MYANTISFSDTEGSENPESISCILYVKIIVTYIMYIYIVFHIVLLRRK